jgi:phage tail-like protein
VTASQASLIRTDPIIARNFYLEIPGATTVILQAVNAMNMEMTPVGTTQNGVGGKPQHVKTVGQSHTSPPEVVMTRMAPADAKSDAIWKWFDDIRKKGFQSRTDNRKTLTLKLYDVAQKQVGEFQMQGAWPYKIETDQLSTDSNEAMKENITFCCEFIDRTM